MPEANDLTVGMMALVAEQERAAISRRTREALAVARARGVKLGNPTSQHALNERRCRTMSFGLKRSFADAVSVSIAAKDHPGIDDIVAVAPGNHRVEIDFGDLGM